MEKSKKVTSKDVAKLAGVSITTVSMVLNGQGEGKFPQKTCQKVLDACRELGYKKGRNFKTENIDDKVLIAIIPSYTNLYYVETVEAMQRRAKELGYSILTFDTFQEIEQETRILQICNQFPIAGVIYLYPLENEILLQQMDWKVPTIHIYDKDIYMDIDILERDSHRVGYAIGEYLIKLGHKKVAFISSSMKTKQLARIRRLEGLREVFEKYGYNPDESVVACTPDTENLAVKVIPEGYDLGFLLMKRLLEREEDVTAIVAVNDVIAVGAMDAITEAKKKIPYDFSVCGCDNINMARFRGISLTAVDSYSVQSGRTAVDMLVKKIEGGADFKMGDGPSEISRIEYFPKIMVRNSTGPCKKR